MPRTQNLSPSVKPYAFLGLDLQGEETKSPKADCPFCGREKRLGISNLDDNDGRFRCVACDVGGNATSFAEKFHELCMTSTTDYRWFVDHKGLPEDALRAWGLCKSVVTGEWLVPSYSAAKKVCNLYRYVSYRTEKGLLKYRFWQTPGLPQGVFGLNLLNEDSPNLDICEGWSDGVALWSSLGKNKVTGRNVIAVPGCGHFPESVLNFIDEKTVTLFFDNDYPTTKNGVTSQAGYDGLKRACKVIASAEEKPKATQFLAWDVHRAEGGAGYTTEFPDGFDVRDMLSPKREGAGEEKLEELLDRVRPCPSAWFEGAVARRGANRGDYVKPEECRSWPKLLTAFKEAAEWDERLTGGLTIVLASIASVPETGDQVWVRLIGPPSSYKSKLCGAVATARKWCVEDDGMNGFFSGFNDAKKGEKVEDQSLVSRLYGKTLITKEGATLVHSPMCEVIISQGRTLYDGQATKRYNNGLKWEHHGLRFTWVLAGTPAIKVLDASELGQRFIDYVLLDEIDWALEHRVTMTGLYQQLNAPIANGRTETTMEVEYLKACKLAGGYVNHLRESATDNVKDVKFPNGAVERISRLSAVIECLRARPSDLTEDNGVRALGTRIGRQILKMAKYAAVVQEKHAADHADVWRIVEKVATDTAKGRTFDIVKTLHEYRAGLNATDIARLTNQSPLKEMEYLSFLRKLQVVEEFSPNGKVPLAGGRYRLTKRFGGLWKEVVGDTNGKAKQK